MTSSLEYVNMGSSQATSRITRNVFQISKFKQPQYVIDLIKNQCVNWEYLHFNDKEMIQYITDHPIDDFPALLDVYNKITNIIIKYDLFKYIFLYITGGLFIDCDSTLECNIEDIIKQYDFVTISSAVDKTSIYNGFIASMPASPFMYKAIKHIYDNNHPELEILNTSYYNNLYHIIHPPTTSGDEVVNNYKLYNERITYTYAISVDDNDVTWFNHYFIDKIIPDKVNIKGINKPIGQLKVGVTMDLPKDNLTMFSNGIRQNALYFYTLLKNIGYDVYLLVNDSIERESVLNNIFGIDNNTLKHVDMTDIVSQTTFDVIFQLSVQIPFDTNMKLRKLGVKIVAYKCGNDYIFQMENALFGAHPDIPGCAAEHALYDQIWSIPQMVNTNLHYWKTIHRCKTIEVPFIWAPTAIEQFEKIGSSQGTFANVHYKDRGIAKKIAIFEPNLNVFKWAFPAILVCENAYRSIPERLHKVYTTNVPAELKLKLNRLVRPLSVFKENKLSVESRFNAMYFMSTYADIAVSHQWENPLNYLYLDLAWMGWPIVHNAHLCKDIGYYYEGFNYEMGGQVLTDVILNHDKTAAEYKKRNRQLIDRYLPTNVELQQKYKALVDDLFL